MPNPCQAPSLLRSRYRYVAAALLSTGLLFIGPAAAWAEEAIAIDFVRYGQSVGNVEHIIGTVAPGATLTHEGEQQARAIADVLVPGAPYSGIYASGLIKTQETAAPLAAMLHMDVQDLSGLNGINAGILEGAKLNEFTDLLYLAAPFAWTLGLWFVPELGSSEYNGAAFEHYFSGAVQTIYDNSAANGHEPAVAFSIGAAIMVWTMMNVNNPDPLLILTDQLGNAGTVVVEGDPEGGWTLESWAGMPIPPANLPTELFVDVRDLITAPQIAAFNVYQALLTFDPTTIVQALQAGVVDVVMTTVGFPVKVISDIIGALGGATPFADLGTLLGDTPLGGFNLGDLTNLLPTTATELSGLLPGELGAMVGEGLTAI